MRQSNRFQPGTLLLCFRRSRFAGVCAYLHWRALDRARVLRADLPVGDVTDEGVETDLCESALELREREPITAAASHGKRLQKTAAAPHKKHGLRKGKQWNTQGKGSVLPALLPERFQQLAGWDGQDDPSQGSEHLWQPMPGGSVSSMLDRNG